LTTCATGTRILAVRVVASVIAVSLALAANAGGATAPRGNPAAGKRVWQTVQPQCRMCHTLQAASAYGTAGPNLDKVKPSYAHPLQITGRRRQRSQLRGMRGTVRFTVNVSPTDPGLTGRPHGWREESRTL
jgi:hypothetical protein